MTTNEVLANWKKEIDAAVRRALAAIKTVEVKQWPEHDDIMIEFSENKITACNTSGYAFVYCLGEPEVLHIEDLDVPVVSKHIEIKETMMNKYTDFVVYHPRHVFVIWNNVADLEHEDPDELGGIVHRFDYQVERGTRFHLQALNCPECDSYEGEDDHIRLNFRNEAEFNEWRSEYEFELGSEYIMDARTGDVHGIETSAYCARLLKDETDQAMAGDIDPKDYVESVRWVADALRNMRLG